MFARSRCRRVVRRGVGAVQAVLVLALIAVVAFIGIQAMSGSANNELEETATGVADPNHLANQFAP